MSSRTLIDISRVLAEATWPSIATEVNGYLQNWIAAANAQVSQHQLRATTPNPNATASDRCGWRLEATLSQLTPAGNPAAVLLEVFITGTTFDILPGIGNNEPNLGSPGWGLDGRWVLPSHETLGSQGVWSAVPLPFTAQVGWSLESGQEYFVFAYTQYAYTNRQAVPLLIARDQVSGHWILAATPPSTSSSIYAGLRAVSWNARSGHPVGSRSLLRDFTSEAVTIRQPAELVIATHDWGHLSTNPQVPALFWEPLLLPPDFAAVNYSSLAMHYYKPADGSEWLGIGGHGLLLRTRDAPAPQGGAGGAAP